MTFDTASVTLMAITLFAAIVNGALGYGFSSLTVPVALLFYANRVLNPTMVIVEVAINLFVLVMNLDSLPKVYKRVYPIVIGLVPGVYFGSQMLATLHPSWIKFFTYLILLPGDEKRWADVSDAERADVYAAHGRFSAGLAECGHTVVGGAELAPSGEARTVRPGADGPVVSEGPYAETAEQLTGFYLVETNDLDDLLQVCGILTGVGDALEVRECLAMEGA